jgi:RNA polymerase sigma-70 factor, ECF subfamily
MPNAISAAEFEAAFVRSGRALWVLASAWVGRAEAQDLIQEAARIAWQRREQFVRGSDFAAWLAQIVRHTGANWRRQRRPIATDPVALPELAAPAQPMHAPTLGNLPEDLPADLAARLRELPEAARASLLLHVVADLTFPEIAAMLDLPLNTVTSHARRARLALRAALAPGAGLPTPQPELP